MKAWPCLLGCSTRTGKFLVSVVLILPGMVLAQDATTTKKKDTRPFADRVWFGGGLGLGFGTVTSIQIDPIVGYYLDQKNKISVGTGISYWYYSDNRFTPKITNDGYGYRLFTRFRPIPQFFGHVEFFHLNAERYNYFADKYERIWVPHLLLGGGYVQSMGGRSSIYVQILFDVLQDPNSVYGSRPVLSGGIGVGF